MTDITPEQWANESMKLVKKEFRKSEYVRVGYTNFEYWFVMVWDDSITED